MGCFRMVLASGASEMSGSRIASSDKELYYDVHVFCCTNVRPKSHPRGSCARANSVQLRDYFNQRVKQLGLSSIRVNASGCLDRCELGPVAVIYPEGVWYRYENEADIEEIIESHLQGGGFVDRLSLRTTHR